MLYYGKASKVSEVSYLLNGAHVLVIDSSNTQNLPSNLNYIDFFVEMILPKEMIDKRIYIENEFNAKSKEEKSLKKEVFYAGAYIDYLVKNVDVYQLLADLMKLTNYEDILIIVSDDHNYNFLLCFMEYFNDSGIKIKELNELVNEYLDNHSEVLKS